VANTVEPESGTPPLRRLVVRVKIPVEEPPAPVRRPLNKGALLAALFVVVVVLGWLGVRMFRSEPTPAPAVTATSQPQLPAPVPSQAPPVVVAEAPPKPTEVIPDVPQNALDTVRGTIRVIVRVTIDKNGAVVATSTDVPGPSRYFARLATEAAGKWTFAPTDSEQPRSERLMFNFARAGVSANVLPQPRTERTTPADSNR
jgi:hypothetical protein